MPKNDRRALAEPTSAPATDLAGKLGDYSGALRLAALLLPTWLVLGVFFLLPLFIILLIGFAQRSPSGTLKPIEHVWAYIQSGVFLHNYARSFSPLYLWIFWRSLWMAVLTTVLCILIAYPVAYYIALSAPLAWKGPLMALAVIPFWTSFLVRTYAWMLILRSEGVINHSLGILGLIDPNHPLELLYNQSAVMIGLVYGELPFMILPLYASLEKLDRSLLEASSDLGAGRWSTFCRVTVPLTAPGIAAGVVLVFIPSLGQFVVSDLLGGAKSMLVGNLIQNQFTAARDQPFGSAIAFELIAIVVVMLASYAIYSRGRGEDLL